MVWLEKRPDGASSSYAVDKALEQFLRQQEEATLQEYTEQQQSAAVQGANTVGDTFGLARAHMNCLWQNSYVGHKIWQFLKTSYNSVQHVGRADFE